MNVLAQASARFQSGAAECMPEVGVGRLLEVVAEQGGLRGEVMADFVLSGDVVLATEGFTGSGQGLVHWSAPVDQLDAVLSAVDATALAWRDLGRACGVGVLLKVGPAGEATLAVHPPAEGVDLVRVHGFGGEGVTRSWGVRPGGPAGSSPETLPVTVRVIFRNVGPEVAGRLWPALWSQLLDLFARVVVWANVGGVVHLSAEGHRQLALSVVREGPPPVTPRGPGLW